MACGIDQLSRATQAQSKGPRDRPDVTGKLGHCPRARVSNSCPGSLTLVSEGPWGIPAVPGDSDPCPISYVFDQASRATRAHARGPTGWTS